MLQGTVWLSSHEAAPQHTRHRPEQTLLYQIVEKPDFYWVSRNFTISLGGVGEKPTSPYGAWVFVIGM